jgi:hypothetical protein
MQHKCRSRAFVAFVSYSGYSSLNTMRLAADLSQLAGNNSEWLRNSCASTIRVFECIRAGLKVSRREVLEAAPGGISKWVTTQKLV